jgi:hypothetical protein
MHITNTANGHTVWAKTSDSCQSCGYDDIDLSPAAFKKLASLDAGVITASWFVVCSLPISLYLLTCCSVGTLRARRSLLLVSERVSTFHSLLPRSGSMLQRTRSWTAGTVLALPP